MDRTCWRGLRIDHPYDWEIARASDQDQPGRCTFSDRHYHRLDVQWRKVQYAPNFDLILEKYRQGPEGQQRDLSSVWLASPWRGLLRQTADGFVLHAARTFPDQRMLVELTIVWPRKDRDTKLEETILKSVALDDGEDRLWQAMGISATVPGHFNLRTNSSKVGKVSWEFATSDRGTSRFIGLGTPKRGPVLTIERLAMPGYWLKGSIREWLVEQVPARNNVLRLDLSTFNSHRPERMISRGGISTFANLRGIKMLRLDLAWQCPVENRVYHIILAQPSRQEELELPDGLAVRCCRPSRPCATKAASQ